jgi:hypothetical protein
MAMLESARVAIAASVFAGISGSSRRGKQSTAKLVMVVRFGF